MVQYEINFAQKAPNFAYFAKRNFPEPGFQPGPGNSVDAD